MMIYGMNWKDCGSQRSWLKWGTVLEFDRRGEVQPHNTSIRVVSVPDEIRAKLLPIHFRSITAWAILKNIDILNEVPRVFPQSLQENAGIVPQIVGIATAIWAGRSGFDSRQCKIFLFSAVSRPNLRHTQPPIQWALGFFPGDKAAGAWNWPLSSI
jgi:hypothetical protein